MKKDKGIAIELMIGFIFVVVTICALITTTVVCMKSSTKNAVSNIEVKITVDQIGEFYIRAVENGWVFPTGTEESDSSYPSWITDDTNTLSFFKNCQANGYTFTSTVTYEYGTFIDFFEIKGTGHKLVISKSNKEILYVLVAENPESSDSYKPKYEILNWSYNDISDGISYASRDEDHSYLWRIWYWIGENIFNQ